MIATVTVTATLAAGFGGWTEPPPARPRQNVTSTTATFLTSFPRRQVRGRGGSGSGCRPGGASRRSSDRAELDVARQLMGWRNFVLPAALPVEWNARVHVRPRPTASRFTQASCVGVEPVVTFASGVGRRSGSSDRDHGEHTGRHLRRGPPQPYDPFVRPQVVVTATLDDGFAWISATMGPLGFASPQVAAQLGSAARELPPGRTQTGPTTAS